MGDAGCPTWCTRSHRYVGPTLIHEGDADEWDVAEGSGRVRRQWRSYDDGPSLLAISVDTETVNAELELTITEIRLSAGHLLAALDCELAADLAPDLAS